MRRLLVAIILLVVVLSVDAAQKNLQSAVAGKCSADFVSVDKLNEVFGNYDKSKPGPGWGHVLIAPAASAAKPAKESRKKSAIGVVTASSASAASTESPDKAFDSNPKTKYCTIQPKMWLHVNLAAGKKKIEKYSLTSANDAPMRDPKDWTLLGSNDGKKWDILDLRSGEKFSARHEKREFKISKPGEYAYYKLDVTKNNGDGTSQIADIELAGVESKKKIAAFKRATQNADHPDTSDWELLIAEDLSNADFNEGVWTVLNGEYTASKDQALWTKKDYENFILDLEFKNDQDSNSGVLLYVTDTARWVPNSVEVQITDDFGKKWANVNPTWKCGAVFGRLAATESAVKKPGEWNRFTITCKGPHIDVVLNGKHINSMDMRKWDSATHNPDGSKQPGWLNKPLSKHPTKGKIGFQGKHGGAQIWFRNIKVKSL